MRTEYVVMCCEVSESRDGTTAQGVWQYRGSQPTIEKCYRNVIGPAYPADYDGTTVFPDRMHVRRRDQCNPWSRPYDMAAIFEMLIAADGSWRRGRLVENF